MCPTVWATQRCSRSYIEKREEGDRSGQGDKRGNQKERDKSSQKSVPCVLHSPEHTKRFTVLGREEKGEGGDNLVEKNESQKEKRAIRLVITLPSKNGYCRLGFKGTRLITNTRKQRLKI